MKRTAKRLAVVICLFSAACAKSPPAPGVHSAPRAAAVTSSAATAPMAPTAPARAAADGVVPSAPPREREYGPATAIGALAVYPITSKMQVDVGDLVTLDDAIAMGKAEVRETSGGGTVNTLTLDNKGDVPVFVLAGTIVKGGNQDRQIGQDFIAPPKTATPIDAFCVEHGRWTANRNGQATGGRFSASSVIATSKIRAAAQYKKNQSEVWSQVSDANAANKKETASGTFLASVDDPQLVAERAGIEKKIDAALDAVTPQGDVVGVAYAIDGEVRGVRWFSHHKIFAMYERKLAAGIALEAQTSKAEAIAQGKGSAPPKAAPAPAAVEAFVTEADKPPPVEERETAGSNVNEYKETPAVYSSKTMMKPMSKGGSKKPVSADFTKK